MSFSFEFYAASKETALAKLETQHVPDTVKLIITQGLEAVKEGELVYVKANGHIYEPNNYAVTTANIEVRPIQV